MMTIDDLCKKHLTAKQATIVDASKANEIMAMLPDGYERYFEVFHNGFGVFAIVTKKSHYYVDLDKEFPAFLSDLREFIVRANAIKVKKDKLTSLKCQAILAMVKKISGNAYYFDHDKVKAWFCTRIKQKKSATKVFIPFSIFKEILPHLPMVLDVLNEEVTEDAVNKVNNLCDLLEKDGVMIIFKSKIIVMESNGNLRDYNPRSSHDYQRGPFTAVECRFTKL